MDAPIDVAETGRNHMAKNIVILSDGTGQDGGKREGRNSNVYHMFNMLEDRTENQIVFYDPGLGTGLRKVTGNVGGMGISHNIQQAYAFLVEHFQAKDKIYLIGFSRGAATVRSLSAFVHHFGILPRSRPELIDQAYKIYRNRSKDTLGARARAFVKRHHTMWTTIEFVGCYDTVAALGLPWPPASRMLDRVPFFRHKFHDLKLSTSVKHAYHALAIDDERKTFHPVLWDPDHESGQSVRQVWFTGMHTDVGGGYLEHGLSDIALVWLTEQAVTHGILIYENFDVDIDENTFEDMHDSRGSSVKRAFRREVRNWDATRPDRPIVHESVNVRAKAESEPSDKKSSPWILGFDPAQEPWKNYETQSWRSTRHEKTSERDQNEIGPSA